MYTINVNGTSDYQITEQHGQVSVNGSPVNLDIQPVGDHKFHVLYNNRSFNVELVGADLEAKTQTVKINGRIYQLGITDQFDTLLKQLGMDTALVSKVHEVKAPMPGLVLKIVANEGDEVKKGDNLIVLEAMKMENMIKSPSDGRIKSIPVQQGDKIEKNTVLVQFH